ncbi:putative oxidoreductase YcjS [Enhygromyxa salina]|uniref:Putative oxidoreductase YcjS n=1 Tax=Enhygromyxa salina TaxID=215803 RepID=A0A2S9XU50_9BACT|nr:putative oxidoreductase YcjS [Enhygromyxa salina]
MGTGWIGRHRITSLVEADAAEIVALCDVEPRSLVAAGALAPGAARYSLFEQMLASEELDGVVIATPSALHADQCLAALERGHAVFCQKPLARTAAEARRVVGAAADADRLLGVDFSYRHLRAARELRRLIASGELGQIFAADLVFHNAYGPDQSWFYDVERSGGGCVIDLGVHLVDLALWMLDWPSLDAVHSRCYFEGRPLDDRSTHAEDYAVAQLDLAGGRCIRMACSWRAHAGRDCVVEASFFGTRGGASIKNVDGSFHDFVGEQFRGTSRELLASPPDAAWAGRAIVDWATTLAIDPSFDVGAWNVVEVSEALDRIYVGGAEGTSEGSAKREGSTWPAVY